MQAKSKTTRRVLVTSAVAFGALALTAVETVLGFEAEGPQPGCPPSPWRPRALTSNATSVRRPYSSICWAR